MNKGFAGSKSNPFNIVVETSIGESILKRLRKEKAVESVPENEEDLNKLLKYYEHQEMMEEAVEQSGFYLKDLEKPYSVGGSELNAEDDEFIENYEELYRRVIRAMVK